MIEIGTPVCVAPTGDVCGEGAIWSASENTVYWTDINRFLIHRYRLADEAVHSWFFDEPVVALSLTTEPGRLLVALGSKLIHFWPQSDRRADHGFHLEGAPDVRLNDGRTDPNGNFWVGSMKNNVLANGEAGEVGKGKGILFRIAPDRSVTRWREGIGISNTLCWSADRSRFYFGDTLDNEIRRYDFDARLSAISGETPHCSGFARGWPDGSAIDVEGYLWNCRYDGACIIRIAPDGAIDRVIEMPVQNITTCCFGGKDLTTLYITTAKAGAPPGNRLAGGLFKIETSVRGLAENRFIIS
jgi:sugar lactone lactonase YvrE